MEKICVTGGGLFDRGVITDRREETNWQYKVQSLTHGKTNSRWMEAVGAYCNEYTKADESAGKYTYQINDEVYFFMFPDGRGMILGKMLR